SPSSWGTVAFMCGPTILSDCVQRVVNYAPNIGRIANCGPRSLRSKSSEPQVLETRQLPAFYTESSAVCLSNRPVGLLLESAHARSNLRMRSAEACRSRCSSDECEQGGSRKFVRREKSGLRSLQGFLLAPMIEDNWRSKWKNPALS